MPKKRKLAFSDKDYWPHVCLALAQVTFGVAWGSLFLSLDHYQIFVVILNMIISGILIVIGRWLRTL